ncbi:transposase [Arthrobacter sp. 1088]|nr:transposase [Arthrobacter sp. 1088]
MRPTARPQNRAVFVNGDNLVIHDELNRSAARSLARAAGHPGRHEATGDYWEGFYYLLEDRLNVELVNARQDKNMPGRKTDVSDAAWLAQLGAYGLVRGSFVPSEPIRQLRDLTRTRSVLILARAHEVQRVEKELEDAGVKLSSVALDLLGISSRSMLEALISSERDPGVLADMARQRMRTKIPETHEALTGHYGFLIRPQRRKNRSGKCGMRRRQDREPLENSTQRSI